MKNVLNCGWRFLKWLAYLIFTLGEHDVRRNEGTEQFFSVKRVIVHPYYQRATINNDIGKCWSHLLHMLFDWTCLALSYTPSLLLARHFHASLVFLEKILCNFLALVPLCPGHWCPSFSLDQIKCSRLPQTWLTPLEYWKNTNVAIFLPKVAVCLAFCISDVITCRALG